MLCAIMQDRVVSPSCNRLFVVQGPTNRQTYTVYTCAQCDDHPCYEACPFPDRAMKIDENGIVYIDEAYCIGCGKCRSACKLHPARINLVKSKDKAKRKAKKCDLCRTREEGPVCVQYCPAKCLEVNDKPLPWGEEEEVR